VPHLKDICDQLTRSADSAGAFVQSHVQTNQKRYQAFRELLRRWSIDGESSAGIETAVARLRLMQFVLLDRSDDGWQQLLLFAQLTLTGEPEAGVAFLNAFLAWSPPS
jgi:hypothetical protein